MQLPVERILIIFRYIIKCCLGHFIIDINYFITFFLEIIFDHRKYMVNWELRESSQGAQCGGICHDFAAAQILGNLTQRHGYRFDLLLFQRFCINFHFRIKNHSAAWHNFRLMNVNRFFSQRDHYLNRLGPTDDWLIRCFDDIKIMPATDAGTIVLHAEYIQASSSQRFAES